MPLFPEWAELLEILHASSNMCTAQSKPSPQSFPTRVLYWPSEVYSNKLDGVVPSVRSTGRFPVGGGFKGTTWKRLHPQQWLSTLLANRRTRGTQGLPRTLAMVILITSWSVDRRACLTISVIRGELSGR